MNDGVGGRALDGGWAGIFNEENDEGLVTPRSRRSIWVRVSSRKRDKALLEGDGQWREEGRGAGRQQVGSVMLHRELQ